MVSLPLASSRVSAVPGFWKFSPLSPLSPHGPLFSLASNTAFCVSLFLLSKITDYYYDNTHIQAVMKLNRGDKVSVLQYTESSSSTYRYVSLSPYLPSLVLWQSHFPPFFITLPTSPSFPHPPFLTHTCNRFYSGWSMALINDDMTAPAFLVTQPDQLKTVSGIATDTWLNIDKPWTTSGANTLYTSSSSLFDTNTGCFTVPVSGQYAVSGATSVRDNTGNFRLSFKVNNNNPSAFVGWMSSLAFTSTYGDTVETSGVMALKTGDKVCLVMASNDNSFSLQSTMFSAGLLKALSRPHLVATYGSNFFMNTYTTQFQPLTTLCQSCVSSNSFSSGLFTVPASGAYLVDVMFVFTGYTDYYGYIYAIINNSAYDTSGLYFCEW